MTTNRDLLRTLLSETVEQIRYSGLVTDPTEMLDLENQLLDGVDIVTEVTVQDMTRDEVWDFWDNT